MKRSIVLLAALLAGLLFAAPGFGQKTTSCLACHGDADFFDQEGLAILEDFAADVHAEAGLSCHDCHGGNPDPTLAEDLDLAKDEKWPEGPFLGAPERVAVPAFCGRCHSDPAYMRRFRPDARVDQEREYWTSQHGIALDAGNDRVATCIDCHGIHGIRKAEDPQAPVYPTRVAETCRGCHADRQRMAGSVLPDGRPLPIDQYALWSRSVHAAALHEKGDFSAPTCNDCHGNHGAMPPGLESISYVCGQCHGREARLFRASAKHDGQVEHNEFLADAGDQGCAACHEPPERQAGLRAPTGSRSGSFSECATCHRNHAVIGPTVAMLGELPETPCVFCHEGPLADHEDEPEAARRRYQGVRDALLTTARGEGLEGDALFDHLVDQALLLPTHTLPAADGGAPPLRPEFARLFEKFRIGKTHFTYPDPEGDGELRGEVVRCRDCHGSEVVMADEPVGQRTAQEILDRMRELTSLAGSAERILLAARRGGVETREAVAEIQAAVDAQIGLEVLVHTFDTGEGSEFAKRQAEGVESARAALASGREALEELAFRHRGLAVFLVLIVLVAIGLALKIRQLSS